jgi:hypothetical protein
VRRLDDTTKSKDQAALIRQRDNRARRRAEHRRLTDLLPPQRVMQALLETSCIPEDIEREFWRVIVRNREKIRSHAAEIAKQGRCQLVTNVKCPNAFLLNVPYSEWACLCPGGGCRRRDM